MIDGEIPFFTPIDAILTFDEEHSRLLPQAIERIRQRNQWRYEYHISRAYPLPPRKIRKCKMRRRAHHIKQARGRYL